MIKCIAMLKRRPDLTRDEFIAYYETRHAPLILSLLPGIVDYRRNFVQADGAFAAEDGTSIDCDVVTEIWLENAEAHQRFIARATDPEIARVISEDEARMCDRAATRMVVVEEHTSPKGSLI